MFNTTDNILNSADFNSVPDASCNYFTVSEYNSSAENFNVSFLNCNIRSFHSNGELYETFISSLRPEPSFVVYTETWNTPSNFSLCKMPNFTGLHT